MSFRGRLTLFFLLIVVLPMIAVAVLVVQVTGSSRSGKADARLASGLETALAIYRDDVTKARAEARHVARDPALGPAFESGDRTREAAVARRLFHGHHLVSLRITDASGGPVVDIGPQPPFAASAIRLQTPAGRDLGTLEASTTSPSGYLARVRQLTGRDVTLLGASGGVVSSTISTGSFTPPASGRSENVQLGGEELRAATTDLPSPNGLRLTMFGPIESGGFLSSSPLVIGVLGVFFAVALVFVGMLLRALQGQVAAMFAAARRIGEGDFSRQVPVVGNDEMAGLASEFNKMSERLEEQMGELRRQRDELGRSVRRIGEAFASGFDRSAMMTVIAETAVDACRADYGRIGLESEGPVAEATAGDPPAGALREAVRSASERALRQNELTEARRESAYALASPMRQLGDSGTAVGTMTIVRRGEPFTPAEREVFLYLVGQASASIENVALHELVSAQAVTDELTGLANNRRFREWLANETVRAGRFGHELSVLMLDVDNFKQVNDTHGHLQGDEVLRVIGRILREESRGVDEPARYGGEEFVVGLPETGLEGATGLAERVRARIADEPIAMVEGSGEMRVTASVGVASASGDSADVTQLVAVADEALYAAKRAGKNRVEVGASAPKRRRRRRAADASRDGTAAKGRARSRRS